MIYNVYKPKGVTSFDVVAKAKKQLGVKKTGHTGTLDPLAEGVLVILTDEDTKKQSEFMKLEKEYEAEIAFGVYSETYDLEFVPNFIKTIDPSEIRKDIGKILKSFLGTQQQEVPMYSAVKVNGQRLYKMARKGKTPETIPSKEITIYDIGLLAQSKTRVGTNLGNKSVPAIKIKVICSSGTYIRSLVRDIGGALGVEAVMTCLTRTRIGDYKTADSLQISDLY